MDSGTVSDGQNLSARDVQPGPKSKCQRNQGLTREVDPWQYFRLRPEGVEPPTCGSEVRRSIQLSYGREYSSTLRPWPRQSLQGSSPGPEPILHPLHLQTSPPTRIPPFRFSL